MKLLKFYDNMDILSDRKCILSRNDNLSKIEISTSVFVQQKNEATCKFDVYINTNKGHGALTTSYETIYQGKIVSHSATFIQPAYDVTHLLPFSDEDKIKEFYKKWVIPEIEDQYNEHDFIKDIFK